MTPKIKNFGSCGCGRSPTGQCCGWHGLTEERFLEELQKYKADNFTDTIDEISKLVAEETLQATEGNCTCGRTQDPNGNCDGSHLFIEQD
jgi:hypothetical protein